MPIEECSMITIPIIANMLCHNGIKLIIRMDQRICEKKTN